MPNVIFLLVDDLGWNDIGCYGSTFYETPNIDKLAKEGVLFTDAYAACPVCSPSRAAILTGKYPPRVDITDWIPGNDPKNRKLLGAEDRTELALEEVTLAEALKDEGYRTGFFGKWHLGGEGFHPEQQGFDINKGGHWAGQPASYFYPYKNDRKRWDVPGLGGGQDGEYLTDRLTEEAISFMQSSGERPFLLYFAYYSVHTPIQAKGDYIDKFNGKLTMVDTNMEDLFREEKYDAQTRQRQNNPAYAGMVQSVDESVGNIRQALLELGLTDNTIIFFTSDNGGLTTLPSSRTAPTSVIPLRAGKGWLYEGGVRVPAIIHWPGGIEKESTVGVPIASIDYFPTILDLAGIDVDLHFDGVSLVPLLKNEGSIDRAALFWHYPHYHGSNNRPSGSVRAENYKLITWFEDKSIELYDLSNDIKEANDISQEMPNKVRELYSMLEKWHKDVGAKMPVQNMQYR